MSFPLYLILCICSILSLTLRETACEATINDDIPVVEGVHVTEEENVLVLTNENFDTVVSSKPIILVEFYAPWCGHCQVLAPEYSKAAAILKNSSPRISLAKVDATAQEEVTKRFDVTGYPTLFIFKNGNKLEYDGPRTAQGIVDYMKQQADINYTPPPSAVLTLTLENFTSVVESKDLVLVEFYAPWCGHCKRLAPEYERAAKMLSNLPSPIWLAKVDATIEKELAKKFEVSGYPTMFIFRKGERNKYDGPRDESGIISYMIEQAKPPSIEIKEAKLLDKGISDKMVTVIGFFESEESLLFQKYINAANLQRRKFKFLHTFSSSVISHASAKPGMIALYQPERFRSKHEPIRRELKLDNMIYEDIVHFLEKYEIPLVGHRTTENSLLYSKRWPLVVVYYDIDFGFENRAQTQLIRKEVLDVAKEYVGKVTFAISNEEDFQSELKELGLEDSGEDVNVGFYQAQSVRFAMKPDDEFSAGKLRRFINNVFEGKVKRQIKSTKPPKSNEGPVLVVVGSTFDDIVASGKDGKDVLIEFYAPWCQHCKALEPKYSKLAKTLVEKYSDSLKVVKMDATANDVPESFQIDGFPTVYYLSHRNSRDGKPKYVKYDAKGWDVSDLKDFVTKQLKETRDEL